MVVEGNDGVIAIFAANLDVVEPRWNDEFLFVDPPLHKDDLVVFHKCAAHFDGIVDVAELSCSVASNKDGVGIVETLRSSGDGE